MLKLIIVHTDFSNSTNEDIGLQHFTYSDSNVVKKIFSNLEETDFPGITVR